LKFLVDAQLPPQLARWISDHGHNATHVFDGGLQRASDEVVWQHALKENAVITSKDEDFVESSSSTTSPPWRKRMV